MTPQNKAEELVWKYSRALQIWDEENSLKAIQCALIAVEEILSETEETDGMRVINNSYWIEVRNEIEKL